MTPDEMIDSLIAADSDAERDARIATDLLSEFGRGYPIENLRRLFVPNALGAASFLASELGQKARPFVSEIVSLLNSETSRIRGDAIYALSFCTTWEDGWAVANIVMGLDDPHSGVRWMASNAIRYMEASQLLAALTFLKTVKPNTPYAGFKDAFLAIQRRPDKAVRALNSLLLSEAAVARRFGAALAARPWLSIDSALVAVAEASADPEVVKIIRDAAEAPLPFWVPWPRARE